MIGAIAGDIIGSVYEAHPIKTKDFPLFHPRCRFTDDDLARTVEEIRPAYTFDVSCQGRVPEAIIAFLDADGYEDAVRNAVSLGGDSDTLACITGAVAEAC
jgi:ADP-ribosylglycohydrolase